MITREEILSGLLADKGRAAQISTAMRVLAQIIASDVSLLVTFNQAIDGVIQNNPKARSNSKALGQLDGYKRLLVSSLSGNLQRFGMDKVHKLESLQEIIAEMSEDTGAAFGHKQPRMTASAESKRLYQELKPLSVRQRLFMRMPDFWMACFAPSFGPPANSELPANKRAAQHNEIHPCFISQSDPKIVSNTYRLSLSAGAAGPEARTPNHRGEVLQCYNHSHSLKQRTRSCVRLDRLFRSRSFRWGAEDAAQCRRSKQHHRNASHICFSVPQHFKLALGHINEQSDVA